ncbi:MAG TPA: hypothetical protein VGR92_06065 [Steroidobacteraceae bacterium]|nr:hypothetical protein [Steroidobacteraceae bacterium]
MPIRLPVVDIPVDSSKFQKFTELFQQYQEKLAKTPGAWRQMDKQVRQTGAALLAQNQVMKEFTSPGALGLAEKMWRGMASASSSVLGNTLRITTTLLKWGTMIGGGLLGGSLFGIDRMAGRMASSRFSYMGLGMSYGSYRSFGTNMNRFVDPGSFLSSVNQAISNPSLQGTLYSLGVNPNGSTEQVSLQLLKAMRRLAVNTPRGMLGTISDSYGLGPFGGLETLMRLQRMPASEFLKQLQHERQDKNAFGMPDSIAAKWTNFTNQMDRAGNTIFKTFVVGLAPLEKPLEGLSAAFTHFMTTLMNGPLLKGGIDKLATVLNQFTGEITAPKFMASVEELVSSTGQIAQAFAGLAHTLGYAEQHPFKAAGKAAFDVLIKAPFKAGEAYGNSLMATASLPRGIRYDNPGNLKYAGQANAARLFGGGGFAAFGTPEEGLNALAKQIEAYRNRGLDTISGIISAYAPPGDHNDTGAYIRDVVRALRTSSNAELNLNSPAVLTALMNAIIRHENRGLNPYGSKVGRAASLAIQDDTGGAVGIIIRNKTGANPVHAAAALAGVPQ